MIILLAVDTAKLNPFSKCVVYFPDTDAFHFNNASLLKTSPGIAISLAILFCLVKNFSLIF